MRVHYTAWKLFPYGGTEVRTGLKIGPDWSRFAEGERCGTEGQGENAEARGVYQLIG